MDASHSPAPQPPGAAEWDERYSEHDEQMWSGRPNGALVAEVAGRTRGRVLDVGCGEGADALWLSAQGWRVTAVDVSQVALDRAAARARSAGATVDWQCADVLVSPPTAGGFDLVSVQYPALPRRPTGAAVRVLLDAVAPGGSLLFVGHAPVDPEHAHSHGFDPADYVQPPDVLAAVDDRWEVVTNETRPRVDNPAPDSPHVADVVVEVRRRD